MLEPNIYALWGAKQTGQGSAAATATRRFKQVAGDFALGRDDGEENYSDLSKYGDRTDWINSILGTGEPAVEATPTELAWLLWMFHGSETVTAETGPPAASRHRFTPSLGRGHWGTYWRRVGQTTIQRQRFIDGLISRIQIEGSTANKAVRATPRILSLDPGEVYAVDPTPAMPDADPFRYTDGAGSFTIDGTVHRGQSQFTLVIDEDLSPVYGDDQTPFDLVQGTAVVTIGATVLMGADALAKWNTDVYADPAPAVGTKPTRAIVIGDYSFSMVVNDAAGDPTGIGFDLTIPGVKWPIPDAPGPNPDGGSTELALAGAMRPVAGQAPYTIDVHTDPAVTAFTG